MRITFTDKLGKWATVTVLLLAFDFRIQTARAQGTAFTYQGRLDNNGVPATGLYDLQFRLFLDPQGNSQAGSGVLTNAVPVTNGLFTVTLDFGPGIFDGSNYWLEVDAKTNKAGAYVDLSPLQPVTPAPYAIFAANISASALAGSYSNTVTFSNATNQFSGSFFGNGAGLTNLNVSSLGGIGSSNFWQLGGNLNANPTNASFLGTLDFLPLELRVNRQRALRLEPNTNGAPNMVAGAPANFISTGVIGATIAGGGATNYNESSYTNSVTANFGAVSGGQGNSVTGQVATVSGGFENTAGGFASIVGGGAHNVASGQYAIVGGGEQGVASGYGAFVGSGFDSTASGYYSSVPGGVGNTASGQASFAAGYGAQAVNDYSFVWSDGYNYQNFASTAPYQFAVRATGGILFAADVQLSGGAAYHNLSLSGGNSLGYLYGSYPALGDGIHLGYNWYYDASGTGHYANAGGATSRLSVQYGVITLAIGGVASAPITNRLVASGSGVTVYGTFNNSSDRNAKQDFAPVSPEEILDKVLRLPLSEWSYKEDAATRHIGPMGQDFYSVFDIGTDEKHIAPIDEGGVALAAIQGLNQKVEEKEARIQAQASQIQNQSAEIAELKARLGKLERFILDQNSN